MSAAAPAAAARPPSWRVPALYLAAGLAGGALQLGILRAMLSMATFTSFAGGALSFAVALAPTMLLFAAAARTRWPARVSATAALGPVAACALALPFGPGVWAWVAPALAASVAVARLVRPAPVLAVLGALPIAGIGLAMTIPTLATLAASRGAAGVEPAVLAVLLAATGLGAATVLAAVRGLGREIRSRSGAARAGERPDRAPDR